MRDFEVVQHSTLIGARAVELRLKLQQAAVTLAAESNLSGMGGHRLVVGGGQFCPEYLDVDFHLREQAVLNVRRECIVIPIMVLRSTQNDTSCASSRWSGVTLAGAGAGAPAK